MRFESSPSESPTKDTGDLFFEEEINPDKPVTLTSVKNIEKKPVQ